MKFPTFIDCIQHRTNSSGGRLKVFPTRKVCQRLILCIGLLLILGNSVAAQRWREKLDFPGGSFIPDMVVMPDGKIIALVNSAGSAYLVGVSPSGEELWRERVIVGVGLVLEKFGDFFFIGGTKKEDHYDLAFLTKVDLDERQVIWSKSYERGFISAIVEDENGYFLGGNLDLPGSPSNAALYKVDTIGEVEWMKDYEIYRNPAVAEMLYSQDDLILILDVEGGISFDGIVMLSVDLTNGSVIWRRDNNVGHYGGIPGSFDFPRPMDVCLNDNDEIVISVPVVSGGESAIIRYSSEGQLIHRFSVSGNNEGTQPHEIEILDNGDYLIAGILEDPTAGSSGLIERRTPGGVIVWQRTVDLGAFLALSVNGDTIVAAGTDRDFRKVGYYKPYVIKMTTDGRVYESGIQVKIVEDTNDNCKVDTSDSPVEGIWVTIDNRIIMSDLDGKIIMDVDTGIYDINFTIPTYYNACYKFNRIKVTSPDETVSYDKALERKDCAELSVGVPFTEFYRGEISRVYVQYNNNGVVDVEDAVLKVDIDDRLEIVTVSSDFTNSPGGITFNLPLIAAHSEGRIWMDLMAGPELGLYASVCIEASIYPHNTCDQNTLAWDGPDLEVVAYCENDEVTIRVKNIGGVMTENVPYSVFADGAIIETGSLRLNDQEQKEFKIVPNGSTISFWTYEVPAHPMYSRLTASVEGCGVQPGDDMSTGFGRMFETASPTPWTSKACMEVRDYYSSNRVFAIGRGLGTRLLIDATYEKYEFSFMYTNTTTALIDQIDFYIQPSSYFDILSFSENGSSHDLDFEILETGVVHVLGSDINLEAGEQIQYRFGIETNQPVSEQASLFVNVGGFVNENKGISLSPAILYADAPRYSMSVSPYATVPSGRVTGRGHTKESLEGIVPFGDNVLYGGNTYEAGVFSRILLTSSDSEDKIVWQRVFKFDKGSAYLNQIVVLDDGRAMLIGRVYDATIVEDSNERTFAFTLLIDQNGNEVWRNLWKPGDRESTGGIFWHGVSNDNGNVMLTGDRFDTSGRTQFLMEVNSLGEINWIKDFLVEGDSVNWYYVVQMRKTSEGDVVLLVTKGSETYVLLKFDNNGNFENSSTYINEIEDEIIYIRGFNVVENDEYILAGLGHGDSDELGHTDFGYFVHIDKDLNVVAERRLVEGSYRASLWDVVSGSGYLYMSGCIQHEVGSRENAMVVKTDLSGTVYWIKEVDFGAMDCAEQIILNSNDRMYAGVQTRSTDAVGNLQMGYFGVADTLVGTPRPIVFSDDLVKVYPNPSRAMIHVESDFVIARITACAIDGRIVELPGVGEGTYSISRIAPGNYFLVIYDEDGSMHLSRFVKIE